MKLIERDIKGHLAYCVEDWWPEHQGINLTQDFPCPQLTQKSVFFHGFFCRDLDIRGGIDLWDRDIKPHLGATLICLKQVHGCSIVELSSDGPKLITPNDSCSLDFPTTNREAFSKVEADGWIADLDLLKRRKIALGIATADCFPVLGLCQEGNLGFALHCGWRSAVACLLPRALTHIHSLGVNYRDISLAFGAGASVHRYEIDEEVASLMQSAIQPGALGEKAFIEGNAAYKSSNSVIVERRGKALYGNIPALLFKQAVSCGVFPENIAFIESCTIGNPIWFSYRRDGKNTGRQVSVIGPMLEPGFE